MVMTVTRSSFFGGGGGSSKTSGFSSRTAMFSKSRVLQGRPDALHSEFCVSSSAKAPFRITSSSTTAFSSVARSVPKLSRSHTSITPVAGGSPPACSSLRCKGEISAVTVELPLSRSAFTHVSCSPSLTSHPYCSDFWIVQTASPGIRSRRATTIRCSGCRWRRMLTRPFASGASVITSTSTAAAGNSIASAIDFLMLNTSASVIAVRPGALTMVKLRAICGQSTI
mmetsp:Transcript_37751/g.88920  ORF Transcript_37751/g.88920 Transcript_37751/m.88920 type:complete len:226 (-) Transcript_37751:1176-1853(-)